MKAKVFVLTLFTALHVAVWADKVYTIYPIPHEQVAVAGSVAFTQTVSIQAEDGIDSYTRDRAAQVLSEHGLTPSFENVAGASVVYLGVNGSGGVADQMATTLGLKRDVFGLNKYDRHILSLTDGGSGNARLVIVGENTDATFCGLASLEQMLDVGATLPCVQIYDYADIKDRGVIEGYYGVPYSAEVTKDLFRFMARYKMNMYMYGAKSDPYHSQYWGDPYPTSITEEQRQIGYLTQDMLREITAVGHATKVNFIWAIHPGTAFTNADNTSVIDNIMQKFRNMHQLGVRQFGVFVDDVGVPTDDATLTLNATRLTQLQNRIDALWNRPTAAPADTVKPLHFVPQLYALGWAGDNDRRRFFNALGETPSKVNIYITGWGVWSVPNSNDLAAARDILGREVSWWWNYPCNDNDKTKLFPMDTYSNFADETHINSNATLERNLQGAKSLISNPMQQGEVSKIALFSIADYSWNTAAFVNATSWEASFPAIVGPERAPAFRTIAPYLRYYDDRSPIGDLVARYKTSLANGAPKSAEILQELRNVQAACATMCELATSESESDRLLYEDLRPWLLKVQSQADVALKFITTADMQDTDPAKWETYAAGMDAHTELWNSDRFNFNYLNGMGSGISLTTLIAEPAQRTLMPFLDWLKTNALGTTFFPTEATRPEFVTNTGATSRVTYSAATGSGYLRMGEAVTLRKGDFVGVEFPRAVKLAGLTIADSARSVCTAYWSGNGKEWTAIESAEAPDAHVKYIVFANDTDQPHSFKLTREAFGFSYPLPTKVSSATLPAADELYDGHGPAYIYDGDYTTYACIKRNQQQGDAYTITLQEETPLRDVRICMGTTNGDYMNVGRVQASLDGKNWRNLTVTGSNATAYTLTLKQNVKYSDEMTYCDFDGDGEPAKYVRLYLQTANTEKWLRLYEIEPNVRYYGTAFRGAALDTDELTIDALTDAKGYTAFAPSGTQRNAFTYHFNRSSLLRSVTFYRSAANGAPATVSVTDDGETWEQLGTLTEAQHTFDLTAHPRALAVKVEWTRGAPAIYEVVEDTENGIIGPATGISLLRPDAAQASLRIEGGTLHVSGATAAVRVNVYATDGRRLATAPLTAGTADLRIGAAGTGPLIVETVAATGRRTSSKYLVR